MRRKAHTLAGQRSPPAAEPSWTSEEGATNGTPSPLLCPEIHFRLFRGLLDRSASEGRAFYYVEPARTRVLPCLTVPQQHV